MVGRMTRRVGELGVFKDLHVNRICLAFNGDLKFQAAASLGAPPGSCAGTQIVRSLHNDPSLLSPCAGRVGHGRGTS